MLRVKRNGLVHQSGLRLALHAHRHEALASDNDRRDYGGDGAMFETRNHIPDFYHIGAQFATDELTTIFGIQLISRAAAIREAT